MAIHRMGNCHCGAFEKVTAREYKYILVATNYFSKWAEAVAVKDFVSTTVSESI